MISFALAIPHTPWIPARTESLRRLTLALAAGSPAPRTCFFADREPNWSWSQKLWSWGLETDATHLLQIQDDVIPAPNFWKALHAMVEAVPDRVIGLQGAHPKFRTMARDGHNWALSCAWLVGVAYVIPKPILAELVAYRKAEDETARVTCEDDFIAKFCVSTARPVLHPIPTIIDHDIEIESTYGNGDHMYRRATCTWREFGEKEIESTDFWRIRQQPPAVTSPHTERCWFCEGEPVLVGFKQTGALLGRSCLVQAVTHALGGGVK